MTPRRPTRPPTAPNLAAIGGLSSVALAWSGSSDDVGVVRYNVHRSTTQGFTPSAANRVGQPPARRSRDSPLSAGTYYYRVTAEDAAGNISVASSEASAVVTGDVTPPGSLGTLQAKGSLSSVEPHLGRSSDNVGVVRYNVHRSTVTGFTPERREPDRPADRHVATPTPSRRAPTTTGSPPRTPPATSALPRTRRPRR